MLFFSYYSLYTYWFYISIKFRFINLVESLDQDMARDYVKQVRTDLLNSQKESPCQYLLSNEDINKNIWSFIDLLNISSSLNKSYHIQKNLTKDVINSGAKLFLYLNSCPKSKTYLNYFYQVFENTLFEGENYSGLILYMLNAIKLFPNDGRIIGSKILEKISNLFELPLFPPHFKEATIGTFLKNIS